jgi:hypothetical protein
MKSSPRKGLRHLAETQSGTRPAASWLLVTIASVMFKITENTVRGFTLAEVLLMAAMNQLEVERKVGASAGSLPDHCHSYAKAA